MTEVIIPEKKRITVNRVPYDVVADTAVPVTLAKGYKKQRTKMRPFGCPVCGPVGRATKAHREEIVQAVCTHPRKPGHEPCFWVWLDDTNPPQDDEPEGDE